MGEGGGGRGRGSSSVFDRRDVGLVKDLIIFDLRCFLKAVHSFSFRSEACTFMRTCS